MAKRKRSEEGRQPQAAAAGEAAGLCSLGVGFPGRTSAEVHLRSRKTSQPLGHRPGNCRPGLGGPPAARTGGTGPAGLERLARLRRRLRDPGQPGPFPRPGPATPGGRRGRRPAGDRPEDLRDLDRPFLARSTDSPLHAGPAGVGPMPVGVGPAGPGGRALCGNAAAEPQRQPGRALPAPGRPGRSGPRRGSPTPVAALRARRFGRMGLHDRLAGLSPRGRLGHFPQLVAGGGRHAIGYVPDYLVGNKGMPPTPPSYVSLGGEDEADQLRRPVPSHLAEFAGGHSLAAKDAQGAVAPAAETPQARLVALPPRLPAPAAGRRGGLAIGCLPPAAFAGRRQDAIVRPGRWCCGTARKTRFSPSRPATPSPPWPRPGTC